MGRNSYGFYGRGGGNFKQDDYLTRTYGTHIPQRFIMPKKKAARTCVVCKQDQETSESCSPVLRNNLGRLTHGDRTYSPVIFNAKTPGDRCSKCGVADKGVHHFGCELETCPKCGGQFISCGCWDDTFGHLA